MESHEPIQTATRTSSPPTTTTTTSQFFAAIQQQDMRRNTMISRSWGLAATVHNKEDDDDNDSSSMSRIALTTDGSSKIYNEEEEQSTVNARTTGVMMTTLAGGVVVPLVTYPSMAWAATAFTPNAVPSALSAYGHYVSIMAMLGCIVAERILIQPNLSEDEENKIVLIDSAFGISGLITFYTGYLRLTEYEKGWDFYSHEPIFWVKVALLGVFGASTFFNTATLLKRGLVRRDDNQTLEPMNDKLVARMHQICNAELTALAFIPLTATFMARGVGYNTDIPWQAEAFVASLIFAGLSVKYIKEALDFEDGPISSSSSSIPPSEE